MELGDGIVQVETRDATDEIENAGRGSPGHRHDEKDLTRNKRLDILVASRVSRLLNELFLHGVNVHLMLTSLGIPAFRASSPGRRRNPIA